MKKLVCESLPEYEFEQALLEADGESKNMLHGAYKFVKTLPARELRKLRAKQVMNSYERKLKKRIDKILPKYKPNLVALLEKTDSRIKKIPTNISKDQIKLQKKDILSDLNRNLQHLLDSIKNSMQNQLKLYADSLHSRVERAGTITGVTFYPEEKTNLLSKWKQIEDNVNKYIQDILIGLLDSPEIAQYQEIKSELEEYISKMHGYHSDFDDDEDFEEDDTKDTGEDVDKDSNDAKAVELLKQLGIKLNTPYYVADRNYFEEPKPSRGSYIKFKVDSKSKRLYYIPGVISKRTGDFTPLRGNQRVYLVKPDDIGDKWKEVIENIQLGILKRG